MMREAIKRDFNHPSIFSWCIFNETWGFGGQVELIKHFDQSPQENESADGARRSFCGTELTGVEPRRSSPARKKAARQRQLAQMGPRNVAAHEATRSHAARSRT